MRSRRIPKHGRRRRQRQPLAVAAWPSPGESYWHLLPSPDKEKIPRGPGSGAANPASPPKSVETRAASQTLGGLSFIACRDRQRRAGRTPKAPINRGRPPETAVTSVVEWSRGTNDGQRKKLTD